MFEFIRRIFGAPPRFTACRLTEELISASFVEKGEKAILHVKVGNNDYPATTIQHLDNVKALFKSAISKLGLSEQIVVVATCHATDTTLLIVEGNVSSDDEDTFGM